MGKLLDAVRAKNDGKLSPEQERFVTSIEEAYMSELGEVENRHTSAINTALTNVIGNLPKGEDGGNATLVDQMRSMAEKVDKIESMSIRKLSSAEKFQLRKMLNDNKDKIFDAVNSDSPSEIKITFNAVRAAQLMTTQNVVTGAETNTAMNIEYDNEIALIRYPQNFVLDIIRNTQREKVPANIVKREQAAREGQAEIVAEGGVKPLISYKFEDKIWSRKKIAGHMEWTEEFEMDFESLFDAIIELFERDILRDWQDYLLQTIIDAAPTYVSTALDGKIPFPNVYSAIAAGILSISNMNHKADSIWMNESDVWLMNLTQDKNGQYVIPPIMVGNNQIAGLRLYTSNKIDPGKILIGDSGTWREIHSRFITRVGLINDQLIRNEKTIVGEVFTLMRQAVRDQGSWIYIDIDAVNETLQKEEAADAA